MLLEVLVQIVVAVLDQEFVPLFLLEGADLVQEAALREVHTLLDLLVGHALVGLANVRRLYRLVLVAVLVFVILFVFLRLVFGFPDFFAFILRLLRWTMTALFVVRLFLHFFFIIHVHFVTVEDGQLVFFDVDVFTEVAVRVFLFGVGVDFHGD